MMMQRPRKCDYKFMKVEDARYKRYVFLLQTRNKPAVNELIVLENPDNYMLSVGLIETVVDLTLHSYKIIVNFAKSAEFLSEKLLKRLKKDDDK